MSRQLLQEAGESRAIVMGTWEYTDPGLGPDLPAVKNSFERFQNLVTGPLCRWPMASVTTVVNEPNPGRVPDLLMTTFAAATDVALFYYVGHGLVSDDQDPQLCLGLTGTMRERYRTVPTSLGYAAVRHALLRSPARTKIVILDCCNSSLALPSTLGGTAAPVIDAVPDQFLDETEVKRTYVLVAAARKNAYYETTPVASSPQTFFTKYLADIVERGIADAPPELTMELLFRRLHASLRADGHSQPAARGDAGGDYPFCLNAALGAPPRSRAEPWPQRAPASRTHPVVQRRTVVGAVSAVAIVAAIGTGLAFMNHKPPSLESYSSPAQHFRDGLVVQTQWLLGGKNGSSLTSKVTVSGPSQLTRAVQLREPVPQALVSRIGSAKFTGVRPMIVDDGTALVWPVHVTDGHDVSFSYQVSVVANGISSARLQRLVTKLSPVAAGPVQMASTKMTLASITIVPPSLTLEPGQWQRLHVAGKLNTGDLAQARYLRKLVWVSANHKIAVVNRAGEVRAVGPGKVKIVARVGAVSTSITVTVVQTPQSGNSDVNSSHSPPYTPPTSSKSPSPGPTITPSKLP